MSGQEEIYKLKYLKYKKKYLDLKNKIGAGYPNGAEEARRQEELKRQEEARRQRQRRERQKREAREAEARAKKLEEEAKFNALPQEEKDRILLERKAAEEKRQAELAAEAKRAQEVKKQFEKYKTESLINKVNELHGNTLNAQCGFSGCRNISSNIKHIKELINEIREINEDIANQVVNKLNESTEKQKKCNCITLF